jgi:hypothetical protein
MISIMDLYYLPRVENLKKEYKKCSEKLFELQDQFDELIHFETCDPYTLNLIEDQKWMIYDLMSAIEDQIETLRLSTLN